MYKLLSLISRGYLGKFIRELFAYLPVRFRIFFTVFALRLSLKSLLTESGLELKIVGGGISVQSIKSGLTKRILVSVDHAAYVRDIAISFDYYFDSVAPQTQDLTSTVDFSTEADHFVTGFEHFPINFPSLAESISTNSQYIEFGQLNIGHVVIDLGAYAGLSSIMFKEIVGTEGFVIAVEIDPNNIKSLELNLLRYNAYFHKTIEVCKMAIWNHSNGILFTSDGSMGSSAKQILGSGRGRSRQVPTTTLSKLAHDYNLQRVDLIKCDIEGAEFCVFEDFEFFQRFKPRIIVEIHQVRGVSTIEKVTTDLTRAGYTVTAVQQQGVEYPLLECVHPGRIA
jgi:FkbM family methyltransferase